MNKEIFKDIPDYMGYYQVSNFGNIRSVDRKVTYRDGKKVFYRGKERATSKSEYNLAVLSKGGKIRAFKVSRLVAKLFIPNPKKLKVVNHIDGNKHNDHFSNLEWCTTSENNIHAFELNLSKKKNKVSGVFFEERRKKWASYLYRGGKNIFIGRFETEREAVLARELAL